MDGYGAGADDENGHIPLPGAYYRGHVVSAFFILFF